MSVMILALKRCSCRLYLQLFVGSISSYLYYLCLFAYYGVQHVLASTWADPRILVGSVLLIFLVFCVLLFGLLVFVLCLVYPMLSVALDCPFLLAPLPDTVVIIYFKNIVFF